MANEKSQSVDPDSFDTLLRLYGDPLLRYLLNVEPGDSLKETVQASTTRSQAAVTLLPSEALPQMLDWERDSYVENLLGFNSADQHHNRANACRIACGGELPSLGAIEALDPLEKALGRLAIACYPAVLFPQHETVRWPLAHRFGSSFAGPLLDVVRAVLVDPDVGRLFPDALSGGVPKDVEELVNISCMVQWSSGDGGTLQPLGMVSSMMEAVLIRHVMTGSSSLVSSVSRVVAGARLLASGSPCDVDRLVRLHGASLSTSNSVALGDVLLQNEDALGALAPTVGNGGAVIALVPHRLCMVAHSPQLKGEAAEQWLDRFWEPGAKDHRGEDLAWRRRTDLHLRLAVLLATRDRDTPAAMVADVGMVLNPLRGGGASWGDTPSSSRPGSELSDEDVESAELELVRLQRLPDSLLLGAGRLLRAASEREDPTDSLIDAAIAWESFLGTDQETSYRLATATARLLETSDPSKRLALYRTLRKLYGIRSKVVHGADLPRGADVSASANSTLRVGLRVLDSLLDRDDLLSESTSEARSTLINLG